MTDRPTPRTFVDSLEPGLRAELVALGRARRYAARSIVFLEGDSANVVHLIHSGTVKVSVTMGYREVILDVLGPGDVLGDLSVIDQGPRSATATTMCTTQASTIDAAVFDRFLAEHPDAASALLRDVVRRLRDASRRQVEYGALDGLGRVCRRLIEMSDRFGRERGAEVTIGGPLSQTDIAAWAGLSREAVVKALHTMRSHGWIRTDGRDIVVLDAAALRSRASVVDV